MGVDMRTYGSALRLRPDTDEVALVAAAKAELLDPAGYPASQPYRRADLARIERATSLEELLSAFRLVLVRDADGAVLSAFGVDDRWYDPQALLHALAPGLQDGSWFAYHVDAGTDFVVAVLDDAARSLPFEGHFLDTDCAHDMLAYRPVEWVSYAPGAMVEVQPKVPFCEWDDASTKITKLVREMVPDRLFLDGYAVDESLSWDDRLEYESAARPFRAPTPVG